MRSCGRRDRIAHEAGVIGDAIVKPTGGDQFILCGNQTRAALWAGKSVLRAHPAKLSDRLDHGFKAAEALGLARHRVDRK